MHILTLLILLYPVVPHGKGSQHMGWQEGGICSNCSFHVGIHSNDIVAIRKMCLCSNLDTALENLWWGSYVPLMMEGACPAGLHLRFFRKKRWSKNCVHNWKIKIGPSAGRKEQGDLLWKLRRWCGIKMDWRRKRKCFFFFHLSSYSFILFRASVACVLMKGKADAGLLTKNAYLPY